MAAARLGYRCHILTPETDSPAGQVSALTYLGDYEDPALLTAFAQSVDVITFEFENVSAEGLELLQSIRPVRPSPTVLRVSQDRVVEKTFLNEAGVATAPWLAIRSRADLHAAVARVGLPGLLKTTRGGYDGKGQASLRSVSDLEHGMGHAGAEAAGVRAFRHLRPRDQRHRRARAGRQRRRVRPGGEPPSRWHPGRDARPRPDCPRRRRRCHGHRAACGQCAGAGGPARGGDVRDAGRGAVLVNEIAPRPHNSGHWTIDACPRQPVRTAYPCRCRAAARPGHPGIPTL